jgi:hypothetical protein
MHILVEEGPVPDLDLCVSVRIKCISLLPRTLDVLRERIVAALRQWDVVQVTRGHHIEYL